MNSGHAPVCRPLFLRRRRQNSWMARGPNRRLHGRGNGTVELPYLASVAIHLLDLRFWILGIRFPYRGTRFDVLAKLPSVTENVILVEAKYRSDGRPVKPHEIERFAKDVNRIKAEMEACIVQGFFVTNTRLSTRAIDAATKHQIRIFQHVPLLFINFGDGIEKRKAGNGENGGPSTLEL